MSSVQPSAERPARSKAANTSYMFFFRMNACNVFWRIFFIWSCGNQKGTATYGSHNDDSADEASSCCESARTLRLEVPNIKLLPTPPNIPLLRALWSVLDGTWGLLKGSWGVLVHSVIATLLQIDMEVEMRPSQDYYPLYRALYELPC